MGKQFCDVSSKYGAPMGRSEDHERPPGRTIRLWRVRINSGGYDDGGAYWGIGAPLYCADCTETEYREFVRASNRKEAAAKLGITASLIKGV